MYYSYSLPGTGGAEFEDGTYDGDWKAGKREGYGEMTWGDGSIFKGTWKNDLRAEGEMRMASGTIYIGKFQNEKLNDKARLLLSNGLIFDGAFDNGFVSAVGKISYPNGDLYYG